MDEKSKKLLDAIRKNDIEEVKKAILEGANVNIRDQWQITALGEATNDNKIEIVKILLDNNANINIKNKDHYRALHYAASRNYVEIAKLLLEYGAEIDAVDKYGNNPIGEAVKNYSDKVGTGMIDLLLAYRANPLLKNNYGFSAKMLVKDFAKTKSIENIFDSYKE